MKMSLKRKSLLPFALCLLPAIMLVTLLTPLTGRAAAIPPLTGLELVRKGFAGVTDFTADITQEKQISLLKRAQTARGQVRFRRPDTFYMELYAPYASRLLLKDNMLTMLFPTEGIRQKSALPPEEGLRHWFALLEQPVVRLPEGLNLSADKQGGTVTLKIVPAARKGVRELTITLYDDGRPRRLAIEEENRDRTVITFSRVRKNVGLSEKDFRVE